MKSTELRIGNLVLCRGALSEVDAVFSIQLSYRKLSDNRGEIGLPLKFTKPIPLTEEWLLKFGFTEKYKSIHNNWTKGGSKIFQLYDYEDEEGELRNEFYYEGNVHIKHVHQLQNLYFALTSEELTIKEL